MTPHVICFDGPGLLHRWFYAAPNNPPTSASGLVRRMLAMQGETGAAECVVAWDSDKLERKRDFPEYKAGRRPKPSALKEMAVSFLAECETAGLRVIVAEGWEADDVLASVANVCYPLPCVLVSDDKDVLQCLSIPRVTVMRPCDDYKVWDEYKFFREYGVLPERLPDYLALVGDKVDGIPGIAGIGDESARWLMARFKSLAHVFDAIAHEDAFSMMEHEREVPLPLAKKLRGKMQEALRWRALITLNHSLRIPSRYHGEEAVR